ncbi:hypothetical protein [Streptomyces sp. NPDC006645]|uniref:hypothetical protein n=1 Tax=unclassified Streptomyces TaxID=2593676 RepID=UPI0033BDEF79
MDERDDTYWRSRTTRLLEPSVHAALIVQCGLDWLRPDRLTLRNDIDEALLKAQLRRGRALRITRLVLHNLPVSVSRANDFRSVAASFDEWQNRLTVANCLLRRPTPLIHRLIIRGEDPVTPPEDMVELLTDGGWTDDDRAESALRFVDTPGITTPLTNYDADLAGPFSDADPSVHM